MAALQGKVALVTGSTSGIGRAIAERFAAEGASVVVCGRSRERGRPVASALIGQGDQAVFIPVDIGDENQVKSLADAAVDEYGKIDILVNNAGPNGVAMAVGRFHELSGAAFGSNIDVGVHGLFWCCKYVLPHMIAAGGGSIVNISSLAAVRAIPRVGAYAMSKAAMEALSRQIANDYAGDNIRSNSLLVGTVRPEASDDSTLPEGLDVAGLDTEMRKTTMTGQLGHYRDIADAALYLASDRSRYITGASLPVDGGASGKVQYPDFTEYGL
jgi:3-oxoacyl-[acyl-carrier protein] reductase